MHNFITSAVTTSVATVLINLGDLALKAGEYTRARGDFERALEIWEAALGPAHPNLGYALIGVGQALSGLSMHGQALGYFERAIELRREGEPGLLAETAFDVARVLAPRSRCAGCYPY